MYLASLVNSLQGVRLRDRRERQRIPDVFAQFFSPASSRPLEHCCQYFRLWSTCRDAAQLHGHLGSARLAPSIDVCRLQPSTYPLYTLREAYCDSGRACEAAAIEKLRCKVCDDLPFAVRGKSRRLYCCNGVGTVVCAKTRRKLFEHLRQGDMVQVDANASGRSPGTPCSAHH